MATISSGAGDPDFVDRMDYNMNPAYVIWKAPCNMLMTEFHLTVGKKDNIVFLAISPGLVSTYPYQGTTEDEAIDPSKMESAKRAAKAFQTYAPHFEGPITPDENVRMVMEVVNRATVGSLGGQFVSHFGNKQWIYSIHVARILILHPFIYSLL